MEIKVLGSVSPYCKGDKNCPGYYVKTEDSRILLDCGNGISRLMDMNNDLEGLNIIISHMHRDHYGDLFSLAYASYVYHNLGLLKERVKVYLPKSKYSVLCNPLIDETFLHCFGSQHFMEFIDYDTNEILTFGRAKVSFAHNSHDVLCHSIKVEEDGVSFVYSGDTGFSENPLEQFAKNSSLLICESTFLRGQKGFIDHHLCAYEAAMIADRAQVEKLMLTHFWPEINREYYVNEAKEIFPNVVAAIENKILKLERNKKSQ